MFETRVIEFIDKTLAGFRMLYEKHFWTIVGIVAVCYWAWEFFQ